MMRLDMKRSVVCVGLVFAYVSFGGTNLVLDPEVNGVPLSDEFRLVTRAHEGLGVQACRI